MSFYISLLFQSWLQIHLCYPHLLYCPLLTLPSISTSLISAVTEAGHVVTGAPTTVSITVITSLIFMLFILLPLQTGSKTTGNRPDGLLVLDSGLFTDLLSRLSSVSSTSPTATPPLNVLSFAAAATNPLLKGSQAFFIYAWSLQKTKLCYIKSKCPTRVLQTTLWRELFPSRKNFQQTLNDN